jgi:type II secretory pathway component PulJ
MTMIVDIILIAVILLVAGAGWVNISRQIRAEDRLRRRDRAMAKAMGWRGDID